MVVIICRRKELGSLDLSEVGAVSVGSQKPLFYEFTSPDKIYDSSRYEKVALVFP